MHMTWPIKSVKMPQTEKKVKYIPKFLKLGGGGEDYNYSLAI